MRTFAGPEHRLVSRHGWAPQVPLAIGAAEILQHGEMTLRLDALSDRRNAECVCEVDHASNDRRVLVVAPKTSHKRTIDLE